VPPAGISANILNNGFCVMSQFFLNGVVKKLMLGQRWGASKYSHSKRSHSKYDVVKKCMPGQRVCIADARYMVGI